MLRVGFFLYSGHQMLDLAGPLCAFQNAFLQMGAKAYELLLFSAEGGLTVNNAGVGVVTLPATSVVLDTLIIVGGDIDPMIAAPQLEAVRKLTKKARRVASVCTGAFLLAALGLLDGRRATTHWSRAQRLQREYPAIKVESDRIFVKDGALWTSAGVTAGIDLALALIEEDLGHATAISVARELVVYHRRNGGQSQFSTLSRLDAESDRIRTTLAFIREHLDEPLPAQKLADVACISLRQFGRVFRQETSETPAKAVERLRVEAARVCLEEGTEAIEVLAASVGFHDPERMRRAFLRIYGHSPQAIRRMAAHR